MPSAVLLSILIHAVLFFLAGMLVVFTVVKKKEIEFEPPQAVERPKMKLKKPKVKIKKTSKPKPTTRIVTKVNRAAMPDIQLPEMSGIGDGLVGGVGGGFDMMPDLDEVSVFGSGQTIGNDFVGTFYDLKRNRRGGTTPMGTESFRAKLRKFVLEGWKEPDLYRYYRSPEKLYTTHFMIPPIISQKAPDQFGCPEAASYFFFVKYKGELVYKEDIKFRFWGVGDAYIFVRVGGKEVLLNCWNAHRTYFNWWQSSSADSGKFFVGWQTLAVGDWIELKAGEPVKMEVLFGEYTGGSLSAILLVEVDGVEYPQTRQGGPLLPIFKTEELTLDMREEIRKLLSEGECSLTNGPVFRDYEAATHYTGVDEPLPASEEAPMEGSFENKTRTWTRLDGKTLEAEFTTFVAGKVSLKTPKGKLLKIPLAQFSATDQSYIQLQMPPRLELDFSKKTKQRRFPAVDSRSAAALTPRSFYYTFTAKIKQTSTLQYDHELTAEFFAIGMEVDGDKRILLDYQTRSFFLADGSNSTFEFSGKTVEVYDYLTGFDYRRRGTKYKGYLIVVTDERGEVITVKAPIKNLFENLENLRKVPVGKTFDDACSRCFPTSPKQLY